MRPARFVTLCFLYSGAILLAQSVLVYRFRLDVATITRLGVALSILATGLYRLRYPEHEEHNPAEYGLLAYGLAALSLALTVIFLAQLFAF